MDLIFLTILCTVISIFVVAVIAFLAAKYVNSEARWPGDIVQASGRGPHLHPVDENRRTVRVDVFAPCRYVDRLARHYEDWAEAFVKANLAGHDGTGGGDGGDKKPDNLK